MSDATDRVLDAIRRTATEDERRQRRAADRAHLSGLVTGMRAAEKARTEAERVSSNSVDGLLSEGVEVRLLSQGVATAWERLALYCQDKARSATSDDDRIEAAMLALMVEHGITKAVGTRGTHRVKIRTDKGKSRVVSLEALPPEYTFEHTQRQPRKELIRAHHEVGVVIEGAEWVPPAPKLVISAVPRNWRRSKDD